MSKNIRQDHALLLKRMVFRCWHRSTREMDLILGPWSENIAPTLSLNELNAFEAFFEETPDPTIYALLTSTENPKPNDPYYPLILALRHYVDNRNTQ